MSDVGRGVIGTYNTYVSIFGFLRTSAPVYVLELVRLSFLGYYHFLLMVLSVPPVQEVGMELVRRRWYHDSDGMLLS
jgi:hypothetical protein